MGNDHPVASASDTAADLAAVRGDLSTFARSFSIRGPRLAWLIGGRSLGDSNIPTVGALIGGFKHALYCSAHSLDVQDLDPNDRHIPARIDQYFDAGTASRP